MILISNLAIWIISIVASLPFYHFHSFKIEYSNETLTTKVFLNESFHDYEGDESLSLHEEKISYHLINETVTLEYPICYTERKSIFPKVYIASFITIFLITPTIVLTFVYKIIIKKVVEITKTMEIEREILYLKRYKLNVSGSSGPTSKSGSTSSNNRNNRSTQVNQLLETSNGSNINNLETSYSNMKFKFQMTKTICFVTLAFFFCQLPIKLFLLFNLFFESNTIKPDHLSFKIINTIFLVSKLLFYLHGISNPIIYNVMSKSFKNSFGKVIVCQCYKI
jgi:hypothetical protein